MQDIVKTNKDIYFEFGTMQMSIILLKNLKIRKMATSVKMSNKIHLLLCIKSKCKMQKKKPQVKRWLEKSHVFRINPSLSLDTEYYLPCQTYSQYDAYIFHMITRNIYNKCQINIKLSKMLFFML